MALAIMQMTIPNAAAMQASYKPHGLAGLLRVGIDLQLARRRGARLRKRFQMT